MKYFILGLLINFFVSQNAFSSEIISEIEKNWNQIKSMSGKFEQIDPDENILTGNFFFSNHLNQSLNIKTDMKIL